MGWIIQPYQEVNLCQPNLLNPDRSFTLGGRS